MSRMRQSGFLTGYDPKPGASISTLAYDYPPNYFVDEHSHGSDQLIHAIRGVMEISSGQSSWLIPPHFAIWIPERMPHCIRMRGGVSMRTLYLRRTVARRMPRHAFVLQVSPLLRALIVSELERAAPIPSFVTLPKDRRAFSVAEAVMSNRDGAASLAVLSRSAGASVRTVERAFRRDTGLSFESWRRQFRLMKAIGLLVEGRAVKEVAFEIGYHQPSAFVQMFRGTLGATPKA